LDGTVVINGIQTIPLAGRFCESTDAVNGVPCHPLGDGYDETPFVAGPENYLAATALRPFLERAATHYSPLVLHGPHGSGKSHLGRGLAQWWRQHFPASRVICQSAADFAQDFAAATANGQLTEWRRQLGQAELLVCDDLESLVGRVGAQLELLQLLDVLADGQSWVVVTARTLPAHWPGLQPALASRLSAGLSVPIALPGLAARRTILERLAASRLLALSPEAAQLIQEFAGSVPALVSAVFELELADAAGGEIDVSTVTKVLGSRRQQHRPTLREIALLTARYFGLKLSDLKSSGRRQGLVAGRQVAMYLARQLTDESLGQIGDFFGGRDHTTVLHGCRRTEKLLSQDRATRQAVAELKKMLATS
jgi:chromosomal replication initiator protein